MKKTEIKITTFEELKDKHIGQQGSDERDKYEFDLKVELLGEAIKENRKRRNLTQEELGKLIGVQKAQISKLERNTRNVTIETILKVFRALKTNIKFSVEMIDGKYDVAV